MAVKTWLGGDSVWRQRPVLQPGSVRQRWPVLHNIRGRSISKGGYVGAGLCLVVFALLASVYTRQYRAVDTTDRLTPISRAPDDVISDVSAGDDGVVQLPLRGLAEPGLPHHAWFSDHQCAHHVTRFARPGSLPDARLASFFRSGNTWTRYLLEAATGFVTCGSAGTDASDASDAVDRPPADALPSVAQLRHQVEQLSVAEYPLSSFIATRISPATRTCIVGKTHAFPPPWRRLAGDTAASYPHPLPAILLVRDPFKAIISLRHVDKARNVLLERSRAAAADFSGSGWTQYVDTLSREWLELADDWAASPRDTLLVAYERLAADPAAQLSRMLTFLGVTPPPGRLNCTLAHVEGIFRNRHHPVVPDLNVYDQQTRQMVWTRIRRLSSLLVSRGYRPLPLDKYSFFHDA